MYFSDILYGTSTILQILQHTFVRSNECHTEAQQIPRSRCFQIENTGSKREENIGISQITELSIVTWAIIICTSLISAHTCGHGKQAILFVGHVQNCAIALKTLAAGHTTFARSLTYRTSFSSGGCQYPAFRNILPVLFIVQRKAK